MTTPSPRFLTVYATVMTVMASALIFTSAGNEVSEQKIDVLDVQRINVREPDGTLRFVLTNKAMQPGAIFQGREYPHPRPQAMLLFYNDEGTEVGGLLVDGQKGEGGGSLTSDRQNQDQIVQIIGNTQGGNTTAGMQVADRPERSLEETLKEMPKLAQMPEAERNKLLMERYEKGMYGAPRMFVGKEAGDAMIAMRDSKGRPRLMLKVTADGTTTIDFMDENGKVTKSLTPDKM